MIELTLLQQWLFNRERLKPHQVVLFDSGISEAQNGVVKKGAFGMANEERLDSLTTEIESTVKKVASDFKRVTKQAQSKTKA